MEATGIDPKKALVSATNGNSTLKSSETENETVQSGESAQENTAADSFSQLLLRSLGKTEQDSVNEEELYSSIIEQLLSKESPEVAESYRAAKASLAADYTRSDGYTYVEELSRAALKQVCDSGALTAEKGAEINGQAFQAAQLDDNHDALFDGRGSEGDPTVAIAKMSEALFNIGDLVAKIESGQFQAAMRSLETPGNRTPTGISAVGSFEEESEEGLEGNEEVDEVGSLMEGSLEEESPEEDDDDLFSWEPISDKNGKLAVILPRFMGGDISKVELTDSSGSVIEEGDASGKTGGSKRPIYRFDKEGGEYGAELAVVVTKNDGSSTTFKIPDSGSDYEEGGSSGIDVTPSKRDKENGTSGGSAGGTKDTTGGNSSPTWQDAAAT